MRLRNFLIVTDDIERSRQFYHDLFGLNVLVDNDGNMILTEGLVLQDRSIWERFTGREVKFENNASELYFEESDIESFAQKLEELYPDTVYVVDRSLAESILRDAPGGIPSPPPSAPARPGGGNMTLRRNAPHAPEAVRLAGRRVENFRFDPNTVSAEDLQRLGFSERQAAAILRYREAGGRFRRKADFAKSYVVEDSVYKRLAPYIDIPRIDINRADSAAFETLPGIGKYFAARMVSYRAELGGYSYPEQLMDLRYFDAEKYAGLKDLIRCSEPEPYPLWRLSEKELARHPYIDANAAHGIVLYRENNPPERWTVEGLAQAGVLKAESAEKLARCRIATP